MEKLIKCNACGNEIPLKEAVLQELKEEAYAEIAQKQKAIETAKANLKQERKDLDEKIATARKNFKEQVANERVKIRQEIEEDVRTEVSNKIELLEDELIANKQRIQELEALEYKLIKKQAELEDEKQKIDLVIMRKVNEGKEEIFNKAKNDALNELSVSTAHLEEQLKKRDEKINRLNKLHLELLEEKKELIERQNNIDLEVAKKVEDESEEIRRKERERVQNEQKFVDIQKDKKIANLLKEIENLQAKARQESQKLQGDAFEEDIKTIIERNFPSDNTDNVPNGTNGADLVQCILNDNAEECGKIVIESKNTKQWQNDWIDKAKRDTRRVQGHVSVIVSKTLPKDIKTYKLVDGVWVTSCESFLSLVFVIRLYLIKLHETERSLQGKNKKSELLYTYLCGNEFRQRVEAMTDTISLMNKNLNSEKKAMNKLWSQRQKQIDYIAENVTGLHGDVTGIIGVGVQEIESLELVSAIQSSSHIEWDTMNHHTESAVSH